MTKQTGSDALKLIEDPTIEEDVPLNGGAPSDKHELEKLKLQDQISDNQHDRFMKLREFDSIFKLLAWALFLAFVVYLLPIIIFGKDSFGSTFFDLLKTIITAVVGYLLGQQTKKSK